MGLRIRSSSGWLRWLSPGLQVKRWLLLLTVSILIIDLGAAYFLKDFYQFTELPRQFYYITLQFLPRWLRGVIFGFAGIGLLLFSFVMLQRSVLGPFLPGGERSVAGVISSFRTRNRGRRDGDVESAQGAQGVHGEPGGDRHRGGRRRLQRQAAGGVPDPSAGRLPPVPGRACPRGTTRQRGPSP